MIQVLVTLYCNESHSDFNQGVAVNLTLFYSCSSNYINDVGNGSHSIASKIASQLLLFWFAEERSPYPILQCYFTYYRFRNGY